MQPRAEAVPHPQHPQHPCPRQAPDTAMPGESNRFNLTEIPRSVPSACTCCFLVSSAQLQRYVRFEAAERVAALLCLKTRSGSKFQD